MTTPAQNPTAALVGGQTPSNGLTTFEFQSHPLRVIVGEHGEPWFITKDVCAILGYANSNKAIKDHCKIEEVTYRYIPALSNRYRLIDEGNLFLLVTNADKPKAEAFGAWICDVVLTSLRKVEPSQTPTQTPSTGLAPFEFQSKKLRVEADENGDPLFNANDLCELLGYSNCRDAISRHVDEGDVVKRDTPTTSGTQSMNWVCEPGMWSLLLASHAPNAKPVKRWVTSEVLPSIRKTGSYAAQTRQLPEPSAKESSVTRLLVTMRDGQQPITEKLSPNKHVLSLNDFTELARKTGFLVISKDELNRRIFGGEG